MDIVFTEDENGLDYVDKKELKHGDFVQYLINGFNFANHGIYIKEKSREIIIDLDEGEVIPLRNIDRIAFSCPLSEIEAKFTLPETYKGTRIVK